MPFRNAAFTLRETVSSICEQTFERFEFVAVNDGCDDQSRTIIERHSTVNTSIFNNPGEGIVDALNFGIDQCQSDWIARMDADDMMHPNRLLLLWEAAQARNKIDLIASRVRIFPKASMQAGYREYMRWQNNLLTGSAIANDIYVESPFAHPAVMFRKSSVKQLKGYRKGDFPEDYDLWIRMVQANMHILKLPDVLVDWRDSPGRLSRTHSMYRREAFDRLRAFHLANDPRITCAQQLVIWGAGRKSRQRSRLLLEKGFKVTAWIDIDPRKIGNVIEGAQVECPEWLRSRNPSPMVLNYVTNHGARDEIEQMLTEFGYRKGKDFLSVG